MIYFTVKLKRLVTNLLVCVKRAEDLLQIMFVVDMGYFVCWCASLFKIESRERLHIGGNSCKFTFHVANIRSELL